MHTAFVPGAHVVLFGPGYVGEAVCNLLTPVDCTVVRVAKTKEAAASLVQAGREAVAFDDHDGVRKALADCTHLLSTVAPDLEDGDPILSAYSEDIAAADGIKWMGYVSSTSVYGDRNGESVAESDAPAPISAKGRARLQAEQQWQSLPRPVDVLRLAGVYGPRRSAITTVRRHGKRSSYSEQITNRVHVHDAAWAIICAARRDADGGGEVFNVADDMPTSRNDVFLCASRLLAAGKVHVKRDERELAERDESRGSKRVSNEKLKRVLGLSLKYPSYYHGLAHVASLEGLFGDEMARNA